MSKPTGLILPYRGRAMPPWRAGLYYDVSSSPGFSGAAATSARVAGSEYATPIFVPRGRNNGPPSIDRIGVNISSGGGVGTKFRLGIRTMTDGLPDALLLDSGELDANSTGQIQATISFTFPYADEWFFLTMLTDGTPTITSYATIISTPNGFSALNSTSGVNRYLKTVSYGALPASYGTPTTESNLADRIGVRAI